MKKVKFKSVERIDATLLMKKYCSRNWNLSDSSNSAKEKEKELIILLDVICLWLFLNGLE